MVNNDIYGQLSESDWLSSMSPLTLLRLESLVKVDWILQQLLGTGLRIADLGCGIGFVSKPMLDHGHRVVGVDLHPTVIDQANKYCGPNFVGVCARAEQTGLPSGDFDVVLALDLLEHVLDPRPIVRECARLLKPGGQVFFHTFNRSIAAKLLADVVLNHFVPGAISHLHDSKLFIKPSELKALCQEFSLIPQSFVGVGPRITVRDIFQFVLKHDVSKIRFEIKNSLQVGYLMSGVLAP